MRQWRIGGRWRGAFIALPAGGLFLLGGCDPTLQQTVENGIITVSNSLLASLLQAVLQVITESNAAA